MVIGNGALHLQKDYKYLEFSHEIDTNVIFYILSITKILKTEESKYPDHTKHTKQKSQT